MCMVLYCVVDGRGLLLWKRSAFLRARTKDDTSGANGSEFSFRT